MSSHTNTGKDKSRGVGRFFKGVRSELKKVNWPNRSELVGYTSVVLVSSVIATFLMWILDFTFGNGLKLIIK